MLTEEQLEILSDTLSPLYQQLEAAVIADIARRINKTMTYTRTAELQIMALRELGYSPAKIRAEVMKRLRADKAFQDLVEKNTLEYKQEIKKLIRDITEQAKAAGNDIIANAGEMSWIDDMRLWEAAGKELGTHSRLGQIVKALQRQTAGELRNLTKTTGFRSASGWESVQNLYHMELDKALVKMSSGAFSSDQCVRDVVRDLSQSGLRTIDYASGRSYQLDTAARMCLRTAGNQIAAQTMNINMESTEVSLVQVSAHWGARNKGEGIANHEEWQGLVYSVDGLPHHEEEQRIGQRIRDLKEATGYDVHTGQGTVDGLHGVNCRHQHFAFFEGISQPVRYPPEPEAKEVNGKKYDYYAMTQRQRKMERDIRALKREKEALKALGQDAGDIQARIRQKTAEYKDFSAQCGIRPKMNRLRVESGASDLTKTQAWKAYTDMTTPERKGLSGVGDIIKSKGYAHTANEINAELDKICYNKSKWSGKIRIVREIPAGAGRKEWSCDVSLGSAAPYDTICHELLHARSCSYFKPEDYLKHQIIEESSVELLTEELCRHKGIEYSKSYASEVNSLRRLNRRVKISEDDYDFAAQLFNVPMVERIAWLENRAGKLIGKDREYVDMLIGSLKGAW